MNIGEIAKRAKVSTATVSRTLNQSGPVKAATARKVWRAVTALNYYPNSHARTLVSGRSRLIGLIVSDITNPFFPELIRAFEGLAAQKQYDLLMTSTDYDTTRMTTCLRRMLERKVDGVAMMTSEMDAGTDQGAVAAQRADRVHGRRPGRAAHEPRVDRLRSRRAPGRRPRDRARPQAHRLHHRSAGAALRAHAAAGVRRCAAPARPRARSEDDPRRACTRPKGARRRCASC